MILLDRLAETEYAKVYDPAYGQDTRFGVFLHDPRFPDRFDANQLLRVRCGRGEHEALLAELRTRYEGLGLEFQKLSGHHMPSWEHLTEFLPRLGWRVTHDRVKVLSTEASRPVARHMVIRVVEPDDPDVEDLFVREEGLEDRGFEFRRTRYGRLGGEYLVGYVGGKPVCTSGWYIAAGVARFRYVYTRPEARGRGYASSLIQHICGLPAVKRQQAVAIFVGADGPERLYEALGFRRMARSTRHSARRRVEATEVSNASGLKVVRFGPEYRDSMRALLDAYMSGTYGSAWKGTLERLESDHASGRLSLAVAARGGNCLGFVAWTSANDLHHTLQGAEVLDLFVAPEARGWGVASSLLAFAAKEVRQEGGLYMKGTVAGDTPNRRMYSRATVVEAGTGCTLSGRAFQVVADGWQLAPRAAVRALPSVSANYHE